MQLVALEPYRERRARRVIRYAVPLLCTFCRTSGGVSLGARTYGGSVVICWHCGACMATWPVTSSEQLDDRRNGPADRRHLTRADRRCHPASPEE